MTLAVRMQLVASQLQIENTIRGLLKVYGLKIGAIHRNRFATRVADLLEIAALPQLAAAIEPLLRGERVCAQREKRLIGPLPAPSIWRALPRLRPHVGVSSSGWMRTCARDRYSGYRFPAEIIGHAVWLYFRSPLALRMVEELLAARGIIVSHETVRQWARKFGQHFANQIRRRLPRVGDKWHLDEVVLKIAG
jgi:putative transposase